MISEKFKTGDRVKVTSETCQKRDSEPGHCFLPVGSIVEVDRWVWNDKAQVGHWMCCWPGEGEFVRRSFFAEDGLELVQDPNAKLTVKG
jgi:hypothetical protein